MHAVGHCRAADSDRINMIWLVRGAIAFVVGNAAAAAWYAPEALTARSVALLALFLILGMALTDHIKRAS